MQYQIIATSRPNQNVRICFGRIIE